MDLKSGLSIGIHFGTFRLGAESIDQPVIDLKKALSERKIPEKDFIFLKEGQTKIYNFIDL
ncbi:MAG: hypothetical protein MUC95_05330 [Spirochaetes bacterium]|nr:hypothetical protein [Spirochaetota bacterium]